MGYKDEGGSPGSVPELGAIFMSSCATKRECLKRKLLGLPPAQANFVKRVKAGMILFLFEFERRELYGVYRASSDGAMNIVPHAFDSSGRQFPAQVRFTVIWYCKPLLEHEFRDAISENYYTNKKLNFGLSEIQVRRLLYLFSSRKSENKVPQRQLGRPASLTEKERIRGSEKVNKRKRLELVEENSLSHNIDTDYSGDYSSVIQRPDKKRFAENSPGYVTLTEREGRVLDRKKGAVEDSMDLVHDKLGLNYDERTGYRRPVGDFDLRESLYSSRLNKENQSFYRDTVETEAIRDALTHMRDIRESKHSQGDDRLRLGKRVKRFEIPQTEVSKPIYDQRLFVDEKVNYDHSSSGGPKANMSMIKSDENSLARVRRNLNDSRVQVKGTREDQYVPSGDGYLLDKGAEGFEISRTELRRPIDDQRLFMDQKVECDFNFNGFRNSIPADGVSDCLAKVRRIPSDDERIHIRRSTDSSITHIVSDRLDKARRVTDDMKQIPDEEFSNLLEYGGKLKYQESLTDLDNDLRHVTSAVHSGHLVDRIKQLNDEHFIRKSDGLGNDLGMPADVYQTRHQQPSFILNEPKLDEHSLNQNPHKTSLFPSSVEQRMYATSYPTSFTMENKYGVSNPTSGGMALSRSVPYDPDFPEVDVTSHLVKDYIPRHTRVGNDIAASIRKSPYYKETENLSCQSDGSLPRVSKVPMHDNKDLYDQYDHRMSKSFLSGGYHEKMEQQPITNEIYENTLPFSMSPVHNRPHVSSSIEFNQHIVVSEDRVNHKSQGNVTDPGSSDFHDLFVKYGMGRPHSGSSFENIKNYDIDTNQDPHTLPTDSKNRTSVFARLSRPSRKSEPENEGYMEQEEFDASVDEVMDTVYEFLSQKMTKKMTKTEKRSPLSKRQKKETLGTKRQEKRLNQKHDDVAIVDDEPTMEIPNVVIKGKPAISDDKNADYVLKETRVVEFKRRSEINRTQNEGKSSAPKPEEKVEIKPPLKRRKLIRPPFGQKEKLNDDSKGDVPSNSQLTSSRSEGATCEVSGTRLGNPNCQSPKSQIDKKLGGPVFNEKEESNNVSAGDVHSNLQVTSSKNDDARCEFSGTSLQNLNSLSPNSRKKLVTPPVGQKEESNVHLLSTHKSSSYPEAAAYDFAEEELGSSTCSFPDSGSLVSKPPSVSVEKKVLENEALKTFN